MAIASPHLILALRRTADRLAAADRYMWGHFGACNCGHLAQTLTRRSRAEIHEAAVESALDWGHAALEHCPASGLPIDAILDEMLAAGLTLTEIRHLEELSDPRVVARLAGPRPVKSRRDDVVRYLRAWADLLDEQQQTFALAAE